MRRIGSDRMELHNFDADEQHKNNRDQEKSEALYQRVVLYASVFFGKPETGEQKHQQQQQQRADRNDWLTTAIKQNYRVFALTDWD